MEPEKFILAQIAEQCERYDDMAKIFKEMPCTLPLTQQQRSLFSSTYKNILSSRRTAWRAVSAYEGKLLQNKTEEEILQMIGWYKKKIEKQIKVYCSEALQIADRLIKVSAQESKIFYYRMKGDYFRYLSQISKDMELKQNQDYAIKSYEQALKLSNAISISKTNPLKLGVSLNLSVFYYQILGNIAKAVEICEKAFNEASDKLNDISDEEFKDTTTIMQLMYDNLTQWKQELKS